MNDKYKKDLIAIGLKIMYYRKQQGITQLQLAEMTSYSRNHIQQIETAKAIPSIMALIDISKALNISITKLFEND